MYYVPPGYPYPYYASTPIYPDYRNQIPESQWQIVPNAILARINGEASTIDLINRLIQIAPDQEQKERLLQVLEDENLHLQQLTDHYIRLTGSQPFYNVEKIPIQEFHDGLEKTFEVKCNEFEEYRNHYLFTQDSFVRELFLQNFNDEAKHIQQLEDLRVSRNDNGLVIRDYGRQPFVINIEEATTQNNTFRTALWTGTHFQITLMSLKPGEDIGLEIHPNIDQFLRIEQGQGIMQMGPRKDQLNFQRDVFDDFAIVIPAGTWHNLTNTGNEPLKLYSIYAPPQHPFGTVHRTKADAMAAEQEHGHGHGHGYGQ
ncbi:cupin domain-containing protein [Niallia sp. XMNu-256]|uniref:cupin domain-containing protein n=1 Tax=Niallia sp. XMNu-256 TaxID=3082444 RepID=UPI0030CDEC49